MISIFPQPLPDELIFSVFSRYYVRSGYLTYRAVAEDLYVNPTNKPSIEFCNLLTEDTIKAITAIMPFDDFIFGHSMINYYNAFLPCEKQSRVISLTEQMNLKELTNLLPLPKSKYIRYLRYCPLCVIADREKYRETYWHRAHQLYGVTCCPIHNCILLDSDIPITSDASPVLITAEEAIGATKGNIKYGQQIQIQISRYINELLNIPYSKSNKKPVGDFFHSRLYGTPYLSKRGAKRDISLLHQNFLDYYKDIDLLSFNQEWQLQKIFNNQRHNPFELSLIGLFLGITPYELSHRLTSQTLPTLKEFDDTIKELKQSGMNYRQISATLGISYDYCKFLVSERRGKDNCKRAVSSYSHNTNKAKNYYQLDMQLLPQIKQLVISLQGADGKRPQKISIGKVARLLNITEYALKHCPTCLSYIQDHTEAIERYWAREIIWAYHQLSPEAITKTKLCQFINIDKFNYSACLPYLQCFTDDITANLIMRL